MNSVFVDLIWVKRVDITILYINTANKTYSYIAPYKVDT